MYDQVEFIHDFLLARLNLRKRPVTVAIHTTCSSAKMGLEEKLYTVALRCAEKVVTPQNVSCCGWSGDRGFFYPELNNSALKPLNMILEMPPKATPTAGPEIGLSINSGIATGRWSIW